MIFVVDEQLPAALAQWIVDQGYDACHVRDLGLRGAEDEAVWNHCRAPPAIVVTKDEDFVLRRARSADGPQVLWIRLGNATNDILIAWLTFRWHAAILALEAGAPLVELR